MSASTASKTTAKKKRNEEKTIAKPPLTERTWLAPLLSGVLLGVAFPTYEPIHLEPLAWIGLVPLLLSLKETKSFGEYYKLSYFSMLIFTLVSVWWVALSTPIGGILMYFAESFFLTIPLTLFYIVWRRLGWTVALTALPFIWTAWEWIYLDMDISFAWIVLGNSQANLFWMTQHADIFGVWGISFWIVSFNVLALAVVEKFRAATDATQKQVVVRNAAVTALVMISMPLLYSAYRLLTPLESLGRVAKVAIVQPNINPFLKWGAGQENVIMQKHYDVTKRVLSDNPDLIVYPETTIPFYILQPQHIEKRNVLWNHVAEWNTPLLTGFPDVMYYDNESDRQAGSKFDKFAKRYYDSFNSAMLIEPKKSTPQVYHKIELVPFAERVPYMEYLPFLSEMAMDVGGVSSWGRGSDVKNFSFKTRSGDSVLVGSVICIESIYPRLTAEFTRRGAEFLSVITNDGWFAKSYGPNQHAAFARLRCIETRRAMARCANTGVSMFIDRYGRAYGEIPWWEEQVSTQNVELASGQTFYVEHTDWLPKLCLLMAGLFVTAAIVKRFIA